MRGGAPPRADRRRRAGRRWRLGRLTAKLPGAAAVLRRALLIWGLGHLALGDRRGILLVILQPLAVAAFVVAAVQLLPGTRWIVLFPALVALIFVHVGQALHAYRLAVRRGATPGGELQAVWLLPAVAMLTSVFWMIGGDEGSPEATLQRYVSAWQHERPAVAAELFSQPLQVSTIEAAWQGQHERLVERVSHAASIYGPASGLDAAAPFLSLRFVELREDAAAGSASVAVEIIRAERVETQLFGLVPTAGQQIRVVERSGSISLRAVPAPEADWLPFGRLAEQVWRIERVDLLGWRLE